MQSSTPASSSEPLSVPAQQPQRPKRDTSPRVPSDYITIKRTLGQGHNATVYLVEHNTSHSPRAMKKIPRNNKRTENMNRLRANNPARAPLPRTADPSGLVDRRGTEEAKIRKEIAIMKKCDHPNIIKFYSFIDDKMSANICLIMEYMEGGELQWTTSEGEPYLTMDQTRRCMRDVVLGLQYLHLQGIIHRDIKPSNIMWTADRSHVKIGDFGVAHLTSADDDDELGAGDIDGPRHAGTPAFLAPEIAPGGDAPMGDVTPAVDLWALGVTLYCMLFGCMPFSPNPGAHGSVAAEASLYRAIREDPWTPRDTLSSQRIAVSSTHWDKGGVLHLLRHLLLKDPLVRWGIDDVKASTDALRWPSGAGTPLSPSPLLTPPQDSAWLLAGVQRRAEWIAGTTPKIVVSAADERNAILEPRYKWNFPRLALGRRFSNLFRSKEKDGRRERDPESSVGVRSEPAVAMGTYRSSKGKEREREREKDKHRAPPKAKKESRARSVDAQRGLSLEGSAPKPRRGSDTVPTTATSATSTAPSTGPPSATSTSPAESQSPATTRRRFFRFGRESPTTVLTGHVGRGRHSAEALRSAPMTGLGAGLLAQEQRTASMTNARAVGGVVAAASGMGLGMGMGVGGARRLEDGEGLGEAVGMIASPRALPGDDDDDALDYPEAPDDGADAASVGSGSGSGCSYGSDARTRAGVFGDHPEDGSDEHGLYDRPEDEDGWPDDGEDDGSPRDVYDSTSSGDEENVPITFKSARTRAEPVPVPPLQPNGQDEEAEVPPESEDEGEVDDGKRPLSPVPVVIPLPHPNGPGL